MDNVENQTSSGDDRNRDKSNEIVGEIVGRLLNFMDKLIDQQDNHVRIEIGGTEEEVAYDGPGEYTDEEQPQELLTARQDLRLLVEASVDQFKAQLVEAGVAKEDDEVEAPEITHQIWKGFSFYIPDTDTAYAFSVATLTTGDNDQYCRLMRIEKDDGLIRRRTMACEFMGEVVDTREDHMPNQDALINNLVALAGEDDAAKMIEVIKLTHQPDEAKREEAIAALFEPKDVAEVRSLVDALQGRREAKTQAREEMAAIGVEEDHKLSAQEAKALEVELDDLFE